jgi:hypothetical protein
MRLTAEQSKQIAAASGLLSPFEREQFLRSVNSRLAAVSGDQVSDDTLRSVVTFILSGFGVAAGGGLFNTKQEDQSNERPPTRT